MFRNALSPLSLSAARRPASRRPSFRPAVEALEPRLVLNGMPTPTPAPTPPPDTGIDPGFEAIIQVQLGVLKGTATRLLARANAAASAGASPQEFAQIRRQAADVAAELATLLLFSNDPNHQAELVGLEAILEVYAQTVQLDAARLAGAAAAQAGLSKVENHVRRDLNAAKAQLVGVLATLAAEEGATSPATAQQLGSLAEQANLGP